MKKGFKVNISKLSLGKDITQSDVGNLPTSKVEESEGVILKNLKRAER